MVINADGIGVGELLGRPLPERVTGIDLMEALIGLAADMAKRISGCARGSGAANVVSYRQKVPR